MTFEIRPAASPAVDAEHEQIEWDDPSVAGSGVKASVDPWLTQLGPVNTAAIDLVRLAATAYIADRLTPRGAGFSRTIVAHVHLVHAPTWAPLLGDLEHLLSWISGDEWHLTVHNENCPRPDVPDAPELKPTGVALLSGGLDSFSGALLREGTTLFVSHTDNPTVTGAQRKAWDWLADARVLGARLQIGLCEAATKREPTTRTRALLFYALAIAAADAHGVDTVEVPENGFTSLNLSLGNDRGGVLSTRSTHPWTFRLLRELLTAAGIAVSIENPYEWHTKGELVKAAVDAVATLPDGLMLTLSCAKLDGRTYKGGNPNVNCGLCVACLTRRAAVRAAGLDDKTPYLSSTLVGSALAQLKTRRDSDVRAVLSRVGVQLDEFTLLENGPFPDDYDLTAAAHLCHRGFAELADLLTGLD